MNRYLLDTNAISALVRDPLGAVEQRLALAEPGLICTSIVVVAELRFGVAKKGSIRLGAQLERVLDNLSVMPWDSPADHVYAEIRCDLEKRGLLIGGNDLLIAAHALSLNCILVTDNEGEFSRVSDLRVENWLRPA